MLRRIALVLFLVYEIADFGDPLMPGAVNFNDDETVYGAAAKDDAGRLVAALHHVEHPPGTLSDVGAPPDHAGRVHGPFLVPRPTTGTGSHSRTYPPRYASSASPDDH